MAFRLTGEIDGEPIRLLVDEGIHVLGSAPDADLRLAAPTISRHHAEIQVRDGVLSIRDLDSSNGTRVDGRAVGDAATVNARARVAFGEVRLAVEAVRAGDDRIAVAPDAEPGRPPREPSQTLAPMVLDRLAFEYLPELIDRAVPGAGRTDFARRLGQAFWQALPLQRLRLTDEDTGGVLFEAGACGGDAETGSADGIGLEFAFRQATDPRHGQRIVRLAAALLRLVAEPETAPRTAERADFALPDPPPLDPDVRRIYRRARRAAGAEIPVLIRGESGTGKELLARYLHEHAGAPDRPFVAVNCAALASDLLEAELFGIEKGVATGVDARPGCFEIAHGGTLFLDEIGDMAPETQARILRVVQEGEVTRVGGSRRVAARPRLISATNRDLDRLVSEGRFRLDLMHRIAGWEVTLPPLRERPADLANLALHFLARYCADRGIAIRGISERALAMMAGYAWPGNVRELQQEMHRVSVFLGDQDVLSGDDLAPAIRGAGDAEGGGDSLEQRLARHERSLLKHALVRHGGNVSRAAAELGIARSTLYRRMDQLDLRDAAGNERDAPAE